MDEVVKRESNWDSISDSGSSTAPNSMIGELPVNFYDTKSNTFDKSSTTLNSVAFTNSSNIQIGDNLICHGPVTIKQEVSSENKEVKGFNLKNSKLLVFDLKSKVFFIVVVLIVVILLMLGAIFGTSSNNENDIKTTTLKPFEYQILSRDDWGAMPPSTKYPVEYLKLPLNRTIIAHTDTRNCFTKQCCVANMQEMQNQHYPWNGDIAYNFVICNDGCVYEANGWDIKGGHTPGQNDRSFGIAFNGNFRNEIPNKNQVSAALHLLEDGVKLGKLAEDYKIYGARQFDQTESPGDALYQLIQTWNRWSDEI